jgi:hypothetical protein
MYAAGNGVYVSDPSGWLGNDPVWSLFALPGEDIRALAVCQQRVLAVSGDGALFRTEVEP